MLALVNWGVHLIPLQAVHFKVIRVVHFILIHPVHLKVIWTVHLKCRNHVIATHHPIYASCIYFCYTNLPICLFHRIYRLS